MIRSSYRNTVPAACLAAAAAVHIAAPGEAHAVVFAPTMCSACPATTEVPFRLDIGDDYKNRSELPVKAMWGGWYMCGDNPAQCGDYLGNTDYHRNIVGNQNIKQLGFATSAAGMESYWDYVQYGHRFFNNGAPTDVVNGQITGNSQVYTWRDIPLTQPLQSDNAFLRFVSDGSIESSGIAVDKARVCCEAPQVAPAPGYLNSKERVSGVLLGTSDVVYLAFGAGISDGSNFNNLHQTIALWPDEAAAASDFDLYVRCNAKPTPSAYDMVGFSSSAKEFLHLDPAGCPGGTWNVAVHSYNGAGQFNIVRHEHHPNAHMNLHVAFNQSVTNAQAIQWEEYLKKSARYYYGMTEGGRIIDNFYVYRSRTSCPFFDPWACGGGYCNLCIDAATNDRAFAYTVWPKHIQLYANDLPNSGTLPHELGHYDLGLPDEYLDENDAYGNFSRPTCGHSVMGLGFTGKEYNLCYQGDHTTNRMHPTPAGGVSSWSLINGGIVPGGIWHTPDNYPYVDFTTMPAGNVVEIW
jgi:hypothetical protein